MGMEMPVGFPCVCFGSRCRWFEHLGTFQDVNSERGMSFRFGVIIGSYINSTARITRRFLYHQASPAPSLIRFTTCIIMYSPSCGYIPYITCTHSLVTIPIISLSSLSFVVLDSFSCWNPVYRYPLFLSILCTVINVQPVLSPLPVEYRTGSYTYHPSCLCSSISAGHLDSTALRLGADDGDVNIR
jgi:hypothetical protein